MSAISPGSAGHAVLDSEFLRLWASESVSKFGDSLSAVAIPLTAILVLGAGPAELAVIGAAQFIPIVVLGLPAGAWVDRRQSRRRLMAAADFTRGLALATVPLAWLLGGLTLAQLAIVLAINASLGAVFDVALASYVPRLVGRSGLVAANARLETSRSAAQVLGPGAVGALLQVVAVPVALAIDAASFFASSMFLTSRRRDAPATVPVAEANRRLWRLREDVLAGVSYLAREPHLRAITLTAMTNNLARSTAMVVVVIFLVHDAAVPSDRVGFAFALGNSGFIVGALLASRITQRLGIGRAMRLAVSCFWPGMALLAVAPAAVTLPVFTLMLFANGFGIALHTINQLSVRQAVTPDALRARVAAASRLLILGALPLGTMIGGVLGATIGLRPTIAVAAVGLFVGSLPYRLSIVGLLTELPAETAARPAG